MGASNDNSESPQEAVDYLIKALNAQGGLDGRPIQVVTDFIDPTQANYDTQGSAACAMFTQDNHVAAVFSDESAYYSENFSQCMASANVPEFLALTGGTNAATLSKFPMLFSITAPTLERKFTALVNGLSSNGFLTAKNKIGVLVEDCDYDEAVYTSTIAPMLAAKGYTVFRRDFNCVHGFGDAASAITAIGNQVLPFETDGVDRMMFVSGFESIAAEFFEKSASTQGYKPSYALTTTSDLGDNTPGFSADVMARTQGIGWEPDYDTTALVTGSPARQRCTKLYAGYSPAQMRGNAQNNDTYCEAFFIIEAALKASGGKSDPASLTAGVESLGTGYNSVLALNGATHFSSTVKDGPSQFATIGFSAGCTCFVYTSQPQSFG